jgi:hypothetical protein
MHVRGALASEDRASSWIRNLASCFAAPRDFRPFAHARMEIGLTVRACGYRRIHHVMLLSRPSGLYIVPWSPVTSEPCVPVSRRRSCKRSQPPPARTGEASGVPAEAAAGFSGGACCRRNASAAPPRRSRVRPMKPSVTLMRVMRSGGPQEHREDRRYYPILISPSCWLDLDGEHSDHDHTRINPTARRMTTSPVQTMRLDESAFASAPSAPSRKTRSCPPHTWDCPVLTKLDPSAVAWTCSSCGAIVNAPAGALRPRGAAPVVTPT